MDNNNNNREGRINNPPKFYGNRKDLEGFLTRVELAFEDEPARFNDDGKKIRFIMSFFEDKALKWATMLRREHNPILNSLEEFIIGLRAQFGDQDCETVVANGKLCTINQKQFKSIYHYINEFKRISQYSNFNDSAKIYMFLQGLNYKMREHLAIVNPTPNDLNRLFLDVVNIESLTRRVNLSEHYYNFRNNANNNPSSSNDHSEPMDIDLMRIRKGSKYNQHYTVQNRNFYKDNSESHDEERRKGLCFLCKKPGHLQFNCPEKKKPRNVRIIKTSPSETTSSATLKRIIKLDDSMDLLKIREIVEDINSLPKRRNNILNFYIKPKENREEVKASVLIDSGSDLNFVHPDFVKKYNIFTKELSKPFRVTGLGNDISIVESVTEKCIFRFRNHFEIIQFYVLRIPDVDVILGFPWIEKHCPTNFHDAKKISFGSGYCARHCNVGKRKRINKKRPRKSLKKGKDVALDDDLDPTIDIDSYSFLI